MRNSSLLKFSLDLPGISLVFTRMRQFSGREAARQRKPGCLLISYSGNAAVENRICQDTAPGRTFLAISGGPQDCLPSRVIGASLLPLLFGPQLRFLRAFIDIFRRQHVQLASLQANLACWKNRVVMKNGRNHFYSYFE